MWQTWYDVCILLKLLLHRPPLLFAQDNFVEMGGVQTLTALLHSKDHRLVYQAAAALSYIVSDVEDNKDSIISDHG